MHSYESTKCSENSFSPFYETLLKNSFPPFYETLLKNSCLCRIAAIHGSDWSHPMTSWWPGPLESSSLMAAGRTGRSRWGTAPAGTTARLDTAQDYPTLQFQSGRLLQDGWALVFTVPYFSISLSLPGWFGLQTPTHL